MVSFYHLFGDNLGLAIIAIAIILRLILIPFTRSQTNMTKKMASLRPQLEELQKKYANNREKLSQEQVKLYKKVGYNPLGCLVSFIPQLIILSVLIAVLRAVTSNTFEGLYPFVKDWVFGNGDVFINTRFLIWDLARQFKGNVGQEELGKISEFMQYSPWQIIDLSRDGTISREIMGIISRYGISNQYGLTSIYSIYYLILVVLVGVSQFFTSKFTQAIQNPNGTSTPTPKKSKTGELPSMESMQNQMSKSMNFLLPAMTMFFAISYPAALGVYWTVQSVMLIAQYFILDFDKTKTGVQNLFTRMVDKAKKRK